MSSAEARDPSVEMFSMNRPSCGGFAAAVAGVADCVGAASYSKGALGEAGEAGVDSSGMVVGAWTEGASATLLPPSSLLDMTGSSKLCWLVDREAECHRWPLYLSLIVQEMDPP